MESRVNRTASAHRYGSRGPTSPRHHQDHFARDFGLRSFIDTNGRSVYNGLRILAITWCTLPVAGFLAQAQTRPGQDQVAPNTAITGTGRLQWVVRSSIGPVSLTGGLVSAAWGTLFDSPREYGPHWDGLGERYGMRLTGVIPGNAIEAGFGTLWGEDPRYPKAVGQPFRRRVGQVVKMTFLAQTAERGTMPAYARYMGTVGNNFLSNAWREPSEADAQHALERVALGFLGRMASNAFAEFWPSVQGALRQKLHPSDRVSQSPPSPHSR
jgi:hypothetical protein